MAEANESARHVCPGCKATEAPRDSIASASNPRLVLSVEQYVDGILEGRRNVLARAITLVESSRTADRDLAERIVEACLPHSGNSIRVGITGVPGAGKSTLIEVLGMHLIAEYNEKVAVLAIDPTSQVSGGSILGDKTRMTSLASSENAFIRPSPARGSFGGVAQRTRETMLLCEASGYRTIFVETVGVGQSETAAHGMVDFFLLILLAGAGDELQGIKRGVMELADAVVVNKADGENVRAAERARSEAQNALHYLPGAPSGWSPRALTCSAITGQGIPELWRCVLDHAAIARASGCFGLLRRKQAQIWMHQLIQQELWQRFESQPQIRTRIEALEKDVLEGRTTSLRAARELLDPRPRQNRKIE